MVDKDKISGFVDGEMDGRDERAVYNAVKHSPEALETLRHYHVIGDVVRSEARPGLSRDRFRAALDKEPTVIAPKASFGKRSLDGSWMKIAASFAVVAVVGWLGVSENSPVDVRIAKRDFVSQQQQVALEEAYDEAISEYLAAHRQVSPRGLGSGALDDSSGE